MKKAKLVDIYKHTDYSVYVDESNRVIIEDGWFTKLMVIYRDMPVTEIEKILIALGFKKEE